MTLLACCLENLDAELTQSGVINLKLISLIHTCTTFCTNDLSVLNAVGHDCSTRALLKSQNV